MKLFRNKFKNAFHGLCFIFKDLGVRIQLLLMIAVLIVYAFLGLTYFEWIIIILCCGMVVVAEIVNYAIECIMNYIQPNYDKQVGKIKDISAGMVLFTCFVCAIVGLMILGDKLF